MRMMTLLTIEPPMNDPGGFHCPEPSIAEMLSDSIVQAMMQADGVDRAGLETMLHRVAKSLPYV
jgi:hypothetical protein